MKRGVIMANSSEAKSKRLSAELGHKYGRTLDGIQRNAAALTTEHTYRVLFGYPEVYVIAIYRWLELPAAAYISEHAIELGQRLGRNKMIVSATGHEEEFWRDARELIGAVSEQGGDGIQLDDLGAYLTLSACDPEMLLETDSPLILLNITNLTSDEFVGLFSKLLDLFYVALESNHGGGKPALPRSPGSALLAQSAGEEAESQCLYEAIRVLSEIAFVLDELDIRFIRFRWPAKDLLKTWLGKTAADPELCKRLSDIRARFWEHDLRRLSKELSQLHEAMSRDAAVIEHVEALEAVDAARKAAVAGNHSKALEHLKAAGTWAWGVGLKIGTEVASSAIKKALGL